MDVYFKKEITYRFAGENFTFDVGNTLFSTYELDHGTDVLLRALELHRPMKILDIGCGYGPIGIILAKKNPRAEVIMLDKDLLAVRYAKLNAEKNRVTNVQVLGSVGTEAVADQSFDLILSNVPAKIGDVAITHDFIVAPYSLLTPGGSLWIVVVTGLNRLIPRVGRKYELNMKEVKKRNGHSVYRITKPGK